MYRVSAESTVPCGLCNTHVTSERLRYLGPPLSLLGVHLCVECHTARLDQELESLKTWMLE